MSRLSKEALAEMQPGNRDIIVRMQQREAAKQQQLRQYEIESIKLLQRLSGLDGETQVILVASKNVGMRCPLSKLSELPNVPAVGKLMFMTNGEHKAEKHAYSVKSVEDIQYAANTAIFKCPQVYVVSFDRLKQAIDRVYAARQQVVKNSLKK